MCTVRIHVCKSWPIWIIPGCICVRKGSIFYHEAMKVVVEAIFMSGEHTV